MFFFCNVGPQLSRGAFEVTAERLKQLNTHPTAALGGKTPKDVEQDWIRDRNESKSGLASPNFFSARVQNLENKFHLSMLSGLLIIVLEHSEFTDHLQSSGICRNSEKNLTSDFGHKYL